MKKLTPMTDFVLQQEERLEMLLSEQLPTIKLASSYDTVIGYAKFLKQPLTLGMFVPCDENGNALKEPNEDDSKYYTKRVNGSFDRRLFNDDVEIYEEAKEKVMFEGFELRKEKGTTYISTPGYEIQLPLRNMDIECLANNWTVELTPYALKQIGLC